MGEDSEVERRTAEAKNSIGLDVHNILECNGMDVDKALQNFFKNQVAREDELKRRLENEPRQSNSMTTELVYLMKSEESTDVYYSELQRRLDVLGLSEERKKWFIGENYSILQKRKFAVPKEKHWATLYFFVQGMTKSLLPRPENLTLSELILINDDAAAARARDHEWLDSRTMDAVWYTVYGEGDNGKPPYQTEYISRARRWGWSEKQQRMYIRNDCMITERIKWSYHNDPAWNPETKN